MEFKTAFWLLVIYITLSPLTILMAPTRNLEQPRTVEVEL